jgi:arabinogalactan oligomer / maltooligosaccharide transport system permease protein
VRRARTVLGWLLAFAVVVYGAWLFRSMVQNVPHHKAFGSVFIANGWLVALVSLLGFVAALLAYSLLFTALANRQSGRSRSPWPLFRQAVTHLWLWILILLVYYPVVQVVGASFDPRNNLFSFRQIKSNNLLVRAKVLPDMSHASLENYAKLIEGVVVPAWQWVLIAALAVLVLMAMSLGLTRRRNPNSRNLERWQNRVLFAFATLLLVGLLTLSPSQFTGVSTESHFVLWARNTLLLSGATGLLAVVLTATAGYAFARFRFPGRYGILMVFVFIQMFPGFLALIAIYYLLSTLDLINTFSGLLLAYSGGVISFGTWVFKGYVESLSPSLEEAAMIDGASRFQAFRSVVLPLAAPMFVFIFLLQFVGTYSEFVLASLVLTGVKSWTVGIGLYNFTTGSFSTRWGVFAAASVLGSLPILAIFYGFQRYFVSGYTAGAIKE